jgi:hypothetical protein
MTQLTDIQLIQRIEEVFSPGDDWTNSAHILTTIQVSFKLQKKFPDLFYDLEKLEVLLNQMAIPQKVNDFNLKAYWLLNDSVF